MTSFIMDDGFSSGSGSEEYVSERVPGGGSSGGRQWVHKRDIGAGGFGVVKLFTNTETNELVVLKECRILTLKPEMIERWNEELKILQRLTHPNIVRALDVPKGLNYTAMGNTPVICMEFCEGGDLRQVLRVMDNCCGLEELQIRQICRDVRAGISFLHSQRVVHRDLKPENILLKKLPNGEVVYKLTDFGYAKSYEQSSICTSLVGTMQYVAPEVLRNKSYNSSVDFWSFGVIVFECVTGKRPFLHGSPAVAIGWVDLVAKKQPDHIYIYWGEDESTPMYSSHLPHPHRLSKPFASRLTSWLQQPLHHDPEMRGGRLSVYEEAVCLTNMDAILQTQIVNAVCTSSGQVDSHVVDHTSTIGSLSHNIQCSTTVDPNLQIIVLPDGMIPSREESVSCCFRTGENVGEVFVFTTALEPSFKTMHTSCDAVSKLAAYGDEKISREDKREVFAEVFFHVREHYNLFSRLHRAHFAILRQIALQCADVDRVDLQQQFSEALALGRFVQEMQNADCSKLATIHDENKVLTAPVISRTLVKWRADLDTLQSCTERLEKLTNRIAGLQQECKTYLQLSRELQSAHARNEQVFQRYHHQYVQKAKDLYENVRVNKGHTQGGQRMQDVLLGATAEAETIIRDNLNGLNFTSTYVGLRELVQQLKECGGTVREAKQSILEVNSTRRANIWELLQHERKSTPFSSLTSFPAMEDTELPLSNGRAPGYYSHQTSRRSGASSSSMDSDYLEKSITHFHRCVSQEENDRVLDENKSILTRVLTLVDENAASVSFTQSESGEEI